MNDPQAHATVIRLELESARKDRLIADLQQQVTNLQRQLADAERRAAQTPR